ncbi:putative nicotinate-nucleotide adenylyltransferase [Tsuneonella deserti]|uniref:Probable nicotinate-nucleotide adenylyltransferase n=1 Tax=Tsuneonella deserti TaxID=2035528 RepID=A0ABQ1SAC3_9SPHN|nr:nicotinate-nucleotide adenylyltransferase [Tsuneonella deserti]GGE03585.1 putative nicotinate-nucleotide adenylyltransferase [Tsuneonella deserti]
MIRTGLLGGSFNPAHRAHRQISLAALAELGLDEVWWLVSPGNPLKSAAGMAPLGARVASARDAARRAPIRVTAIERELGTRYTIDTLRALQRRFPRRRFVWIMGADNLAQFHRWKDWRAIARTMPIAVFARPGYARKAFTSPAMSWLRRYRVSPGALAAGSRLPMIAWIGFDPDPMSATALREAEPLWADRYARSRPRDGVSGRLID